METIKETPIYFKFRQGFKTSVVNSFIYNPDILNI